MAIVNSWEMPSTAGGYREFHINPSIFFSFLFQILLSFGDADADADADADGLSDGDDGGNNEVMILAAE